MFYVARVASIIPFQKMNLRLTKIDKNLFDRRKHNSIT